MLAKIAPLTNDFRAVARYLVRGKSGTPDPKRMAWATSQNLPTDDPELAAAYMAATAEASLRTKKAAYHLMIAWHARERPTPELMQDVARQTLELAGLGEHQALIMGHGDKPHPHLHILLNRVHPETGLAWKTAHDYATFDRIMQALSDTHGCEYAPAHVYNPELTDARPKGPGTRATRAARGGAQTARPQWSRKASREVGDLLSEDVEQSSTLEDVVAILDRYGLEIEAKGQGHVIGNADGYAKLSSINLASSARVLEMWKAIAIPSRKPALRRRSVFEVDGVDITRAMVTCGLADKEDVAAAVQDRRLEREHEAARRAMRSSTSLASYGLLGGLRRQRTSMNGKVRPARQLPQSPDRVRRPDAPGPAKSPADR